MHLNELLATSKRSSALQALAARIQSGVYAVGEAIPAERVLASDLHVARVTIRHALQQLEDAGVLERSPGGRKRYVASRFTPQGAAPAPGDLLFVSRRKEDPTPANIPGELYLLDIGITRAMRDAGKLWLTLCTELITEPMVRQLERTVVAGAIFGFSADLETGAVALARNLAAHGVVVVVNSDDRDWQDSNRVVSDHAAGSRLLTEHLLARECRGIVQLCHDGDPYWCRARRRGYEQAMAAAGLQPLPPISLEGLAGGRFGPGSEKAFDTHSRLHAGLLAEAVLQANPPVDAILCESDSQLFPVARACRILGRTPGKDLLLTGYDNYWQDCPERKLEDITPAATIDKDELGTGRRMTELLLEQMAAPAAKPIREVRRPALVQPDYL